MVIKDKQQFLFVAVALFSFFAGVLFSNLSFISKVSPVSLIGEVLSDQTPIPGYVETGGIVAFEAENMDSNISRNNHTWTNATDTRAVGSTYINTTDGGLIFTAPNAAETQYLVNFSTTGTYYVWLRQYAPSGTSNAIGVGLDGVPSMPIIASSYGSWIWSNKDTTKAPVVLNVTSPGQHTLSIWERKDGTRLDRIVLSTSSTPPTGTGPAESTRTLANPTPTLTPDPNATPTATPTATLTPSPTASPTPTTVPITFNAARFQENPLIKPSMLSGTSGSDINGPSLIKVPDWIPNKLGTYYMYFAHHSGSYIRMAYANNLHGPWKVYAPGTLKLSQAAGCSGHIASPDVHIDNTNRKLIMYYHCPGKGTTVQYSFVSTSTDGINFTAQTTRLGLSYFRVFQYGGYYYALGKKDPSSQYLYRSSSPYTGFIRGQNILPSSRHTAVFLNGNTAYIFYSRIGDAPERILMSTMNLSGTWTTWKPSAPVEIIRPQYTYEGANLVVKASAFGEINGPANQLRDPGIYVEDGRIYLLYTVAGEQGIASAELTPTSPLSVKATLKW